MGGIVGGGGAPAGGGGAPEGGGGPLCADEVEEEAGVGM